MWKIALTAAKTFLSNQLNTLSYALLGALIVALGWSASLKLDVHDLNSKLSTCKSDKENLFSENSALQSDKAKYEGRIAQGNYDANVSKEEAKKETIVIHDRAKEEIKRIKELPYDSNKTDYENAIAHAERSGI